ncbi:MAG: DUF4097 family beta strand repeat-containing protein [Thermoactinomyces sp.]
MFMKKLFGILLILCGFGILIGSAVSSRLGGWWFGDKKSTHGITVDNVHEIRIDTTQNVAVIPENRQDVKVVLQGKGIDSADLNMQKKGGELTILVKPKWYLWLRPDNEIRLNVYVPARYDQNMAIHSLGGNLYFVGRASSQTMKLRELKVDMAAGNVDLKNLHVNRLETNSMAGNTLLEWVTAETANFHSSSGNVKLNHFSGSFHASLALGNLEAQVDSVSGLIQADQVSGSMEVNLPQDSDFALKAQVNSGDIDCEFPCRKNREDWEVTATATSKSGKNKIQLHNVSGNIHIY